MNAFANTVYVDNAKPIIVTQKTSNFTIQLPSNATTGYRWFIPENNNSFVKVIHHVYEAPSNKEVIGAPGVERWEFGVVKDAFIAPKIMTITFIYTRPWDVSNQKRIIFTILSE